MKTSNAMQDGNGMSKKIMDISHFKFEWKWYNNGFKDILVKFCGKKSFSKKKQQLLLNLGT